MPSSKSTESKSGGSRDQEKAFPPDPDADVILRSSDSVDFPVRRTVLADVSAFFKQMFSLPQGASPDLSPEGTSKDAELPVIPVAEDGKTLSLFLRCASGLALQMYLYNQEIS